VKAFDHMPVVSPSDENEVRMPFGRIAFAYFSAELQAVHDWHLPIRNNEVRALRLVHRRGAASVAGDLARVT
jgi:hypothetical protein